MPKLVILLGRRIKFKKSIYANEVQNCPIKLEERWEIWLKFFLYAGVASMVIAQPRKTVAISPAISKNTPNDVVLSFN